MILSWKPFALGLSCSIYTIWIPSSATYFLNIPKVNSRPLVEQICFGVPSLQNKSDSSSSKSWAVRMRQTRIPRHLRQCSSITVRTKYSAIAKAARVYIVAPQMTVPGAVRNRAQEPSCRCDRPRLILRRSSFDTGSCQIRSTHLWFAF